MAESVSVLESLPVPALVLELEFLSVPMSVSVPVTLLAFVLTHQMKLLNHYLCHWHFLR